MKNTLTPRQKFANHFNLKEDFLIEDTFIRGCETHEGEEIKFEITLEDEDSLFDLENEMFSIKNFTRDLNGANEWILDCLVFSIGFDYEINYNENIEFSFDVYKFVSQEAVFNHFIPYISEEHSVLTIKEVA
ncbi:hypothetical protein N9V61_04120 [Flavobacteriaceae bacterium]|nr:hypothetical protein [Flavobacteriaceae bacterium]